MSLNEDRVLTLLTKLKVEYERRTPKSRELFERAYRVLPGGVTYHIRYYEPYPAFINKASGVKVWDVDGNEYVDYWMGHGAHILGHSPDFVMKAVCQACLEGTHLGYASPLEVEYAELLVRVIPSAEQVRFCNSGTEANMYAIRLARAYTRRNFIVKIEGGWHGGYDGLHIGVTPPFDKPESLGLPPEHVKYVIVVPFNDIHALERALRMYEAAAVIMEPVLGAGGAIPPEPDYLKAVRELTERHGALLIFDEVITGFRLALGGAQEYFGVKPDITTLGKVVGGGFPGAGAIAGRRDIMELLDQIKRPKSKERAFHGGTFTGNKVTLMAGYTLVKYLSERRGLYESFNALWNYIRGLLDRECEYRDRICWITGVGSLIGIHFTRRRPVNATIAYLDRISESVYKALHLYALVNGVLYMTPHMPHLMPSMIHTKEHGENLVSLFSSFLDEIVRR